MSTAPTDTGQQGQQDGGGWVRSICVATFDVGTGHTLEEVSERSSSGVALPFHLSCQRTTYPSEPKQHRSSNFLYVFSSPNQTLAEHLMVACLALYFKQRLLSLGCWCVSKAQPVATLSFSSDEWPEEA